MARLGQELFHEPKVRHPSGAKEFLLLDIHVDDFRLRRCVF
jgi:hypothetical protein